MDEKIKNIKPKPNMGKEIDHLINYPRTKRNIKLRGAEKTEQDRLIARKFGKDFFFRNDRIRP